MNDELAQFAKVFQDEDALRKSIARLFRHRPDVSGVEITHGPLERGKDIVFYVSDPIGERKLYACVIKNGKLTGAADADKGAALNVLNQVTQALENPYLNPSGQNDDVTHVYVMTPHEVSQSTMFSIQGALRGRSGQVTFCCGGKLLGLFRQYLPDFMLESGDLGIYVSQLQGLIEKDDPVTVLLSENSVFGAPSQFRRTYVKQKFLCPLVEYRNTLAVPNGRRFTEPMLRDDVRELRSQLADAAALVSLPHSWYGTNMAEKEAESVASSLRRIASTLVEKWDEGYNDYEKKTPGANRAKRNDAVLATPFLSGDLAGLNSNLSHAQRLVLELESKIEEANSFVRASHTFETVLLSKPGYLTYCKVREVANRISTLVQPKSRERVYTLPDDLLESFAGSILITGSAGHGKTSFCQHHAEADAKALINRKSAILPVYLKLHHLASRKLGEFEEEFFYTTELKSLAKKGNDAARARIKTIRLYLDGLDEVPRVERQKELMELAKSAVDSDPRIQVIVTARNYVNGPWLNWMPRVAISELDAAQIEELVGGLLGGDEQSVDLFLKELKKVPSLQPLMKVPLLGTLIVSVYKKRTALPENRVRLYETFLNLMCGGWDLAKNVRRRTEFGSVAKLSVLRRLAGHMQLNKMRECNEHALQVAVKSSNALFLAKLNELIEELLQDGVLARSGVAYAFSHQSFQEYLAAQELNDPSGRRQENILRWFLRGEDWWFQTLSFYIGSLGKPDDTENWLRTSVQDVAASGGAASDAAQRYERLLECISESAPGYIPKSTNPFVNPDIVDRAKPSADYSQDAKDQGQ